MNNLVIRKPDDWHVHFREGEMLKAVVRFTARDFARAIVMPNLSQPVVRTADAIRYRREIHRAIPNDPLFTPLMTCYLRDELDLADVKAGFEDKVFYAAKLYPAGATTNSHRGVRNLEKLVSTFAMMERIGIPLLVHGESADPDVDIFDREKIFVDRQLMPLLRAFPGIRVVLEHITTSYACNFVEQFESDRLAATITAHHLRFNRNAMFAGGFNPHAYCLPIAKRERDRLALRKAATGGSARFFLGTDSAPHLIEKKECASGCAGVFSAPAALATYAEVFEEEGALNQLEAFTSLNGPRFYRLPPNDERIVLSQTTQAITASVMVGESAVKCFRGGETVRWMIKRPKDDDR
jgi:dihydroorotase